MSDNNSPRRTRSANQSVSSYSRNSSHSPYVSSRRASSKKKTSGVLRAVKIAFGILLVALIGIIAAAIMFITMINGSLHDGIYADTDLKDTLTQSSVGKPFYMLLIGTDGSKERDESGQFGGVYRSDAMILVRVDPKTPQMTLVSIERDTYVDIDGYGPNKINAAFAFGGAPLAVRTVSDFAGVPIAHYAEVDFDGFKAVVDALGGIEVDVPIEIDDVHTGKLSAGKQTLTGEQALVLARSRHAYDDYGGGDMYRTANQRMVLGAMVKKLTSSDPATIISSFKTLAEYIKTDLTATDIARLAASMHGIDTKTQVYSAINPTISSYEYDTWYEYSNETAWRAMMNRVDKGLSPTIDAADSANRGGVVDGTLDPSYLEASILGGAKTVSILNGSGVTGVAGEVSTMLENVGYSVESVGTAAVTDFKDTIIVYNNDDEAEFAQNVQQALGFGAVEKNQGTYFFRWEGDHDYRLLTH